MEESWEDLIEIADHREPYIERWRQASGLAEMASLTAAYIEGRSPYFPGSTAERVDAETSRITAELARLNHLGCMTVISQPGMDEGRRRQRAFVAGYAGCDMAMRLARLDLYSDLMVLVAPAADAEAPKTLVIMDDGQPRGWMGIPSARQFPIYSAVVNADAMSELEASYSILLVDLEWGREDHLWELIAEALGDDVPNPCMTLRPHPDMRMDVDYFC